LNASKLLQDGEFSARDEERVRFFESTRPESVDIVRNIKGNMWTFEVRDSVKSFSKAQWLRVVAVITDGNEWQFKGWPFENIVDLFATCKGIFFNEVGKQLPTHVIDWNVSILKLTPLQFQHRFAAIRDAFWIEVEKFLNLYYEPHGVNETKKALFVYSQLGKEVASCYERLHHYTEREIREEGFKEPLVNKLWMEALKSNFTKREMDLFKSQLEAFQGKLRKQEGLLRHAKEVERRYAHRFENDQELHPGMKMDMARQVKKMKEENKSRYQEVKELYKKITSKLFTNIPEHLPDEL